MVVIFIAICCWLEIYYFRNFSILFIEKVQWFIYYKACIINYMHRMCQIFLWNVSVWSDKLQQQSKDKSVNLLDEIHLLSNSLQDSIFYFCTTVEISLIIPRHLVILWFPQSNKNTKNLVYADKKKEKNYLSHLLWMTEWIRTQFVLTLIDKKWDE